MKHSENDQQEKESLEAHDDMKVTAQTFNITFMY